MFSQLTMSFILGKPWHPRIRQLLTLSIPCGTLIIFDIKSAVLEQYNFGYAPFVLCVYWKKNYFAVKSTPIPISNVNIFL